MARIKCKCDGCGNIHDLNRTEEIPNEVISLVCNWCPICEDTARDYYEEEYRYFEVDETQNPNQISLF